jgi:hypothetical protein
MEENSTTEATQRNHSGTVAAAWLIIALAPLLSESGTYSGHRLLISAGFVVTAVLYGMRYVRSNVGGGWPRFLQWVCAAVNVCILVYIVLS